MWKPSEFSKEDHSAPAEVFKKFIECATKGDIAGALEESKKLQSNPKILAGMMAQYVAAHPQNEKLPAMPREKSQTEEEYEDRFRELVDATMDGQTARAKFMGHVLQVENPALFTKCTANFVIEFLVRNDHPGKQEWLRAKEQKESDSAKAKEKMSQEKRLGMLRKFTHAAALVAAFGTGIGVTLLSQSEKKNGHEFLTVERERELEKIRGELLSPSQITQLHGGLTDQSMNLRSEAINSTAIGQSNIGGSASQDMDISHGAGAQYAPNYGGRQ